MSEVQPNNPPTPELASTPDRSTYISSTALTVAIVWACLAVVFAAVLLANAKDESYGGDAYTGIQNTVAWAVRGIAFLLFGSGALGMVIAIRRDRS